MICSHHQPSSGRLFRLVILLTSLTLPFSLSAHESGEAGTAAADDTPAYEKAPTASSEIHFGPVAIKVLVDAAALGSDEVEVGEITLPPGHSSTAHAHGAIEIFYVVSGVMNHVVNGTAHRLDPGMIGIVRPGDPVTHEVIGTEPVVAVVIWAPGGEAARLKALAAGN